MEVNCLIVDDDPLALDLMESYVKRTPFLKLVARCSNALEVLQVLREEAVDLIFLDIQMPELNGLELSRVLDKQIKVIFTTAFEQYTSPIVSLISMKSLEEMLPASFCRVHRSFIVNLNRITVIERNRIVFGKTYIPIAESSKDKFMEFLNKRTIK